MTDKRHNGTKEKTFTEADTVKAVRDFFVNNEAVQSSFLHSLRIEAVRRLHAHIKAGATFDPDQDNLYIQWQYDAEPPQAIYKKHLTEDEARNLTAIVLKRCFISYLELQTRNVKIDQREDPSRIELSQELEAELKALPKLDRELKRAEIEAGFQLAPLKLTGTYTAPGGETRTFVCWFSFGIRPLTTSKTGQTFFPIEAGLDFQEGDPSALTEAVQDDLLNGLLKYLEELIAPYRKAIEDIKDIKEDSLPIVANQQALLDVANTSQPSQSKAISRKNFSVAGGYSYPIYSLSKTEKDLPLLRQFYEPQTPLNWAVGLTLFYGTKEDKVRTGDWQEMRIADLEDRVFCLTDRNAYRRGDHRTDILAEVVKLHTTRNYYYEIDTVRVGRAWKKEIVFGSQYAIPELQLVFLDTKTGKRAFPTDAAVQALAIPLEVKGRRVLKPDGKDILALPKGRWKLEAIRWRWVQAFNDDLLMTPALVEKGKRKGLPKKTATGKIIRKGYQVRVTDNIFTALYRLRAEGPRSEYACRLLVMLAHNLNRTEEGIYADRVFRMLGIPEDYNNKTHERPEDPVARAIVRLMESDIKALLPTSDTMPRTDPNPDRRKGPYYRLVRSPDYTPRRGIISKEEAETIKAEYAKDAAPVQPPELPEGPKLNQAVLPGMEETAGLPIPSGSEIKAAREAAGMNLRRFAEAMNGPSFKTWSMIETGQRSASAGRIPEDVWKRVRDFIAQHKPEANPNSEKGSA